MQTMRSIGSKSPFWSAAQKAASGHVGLIAFAGTMFVSASLLFVVQPLFAKMVLPYFGGSSSVWAVAMCFFQGSLLIGYCYAHALNRFVPIRLAFGVHLAVCLAAMTVLPFAVLQDANELSEGNIYVRLIWVLAAGVGLPFFAISANAPLLQAWFSRCGHPHASDPYFLYGASNLGSLIALLSYPFVIEPLLGLDSQIVIWAMTFVLLTVMLAVCAVLLLLRPNIPKPACLVHRSPGTLRSRLVWIGLAFIPSALLVAFTTHITTDIASAPLLWVLPLATFLGTFVITFRQKSLIYHPAVLRIQPILVTVSIVTLAVPAFFGAMLHGVIGYLTFCVTVLVCHRALFEARPATENLTEFYLYMSFGGVLGGIFAALIAPQIFNSVVEFPLLILAGLFARSGVFGALYQLDLRGLSWRQWAIALLVAVICLLQVGGVGTQASIWLVSFLAPIVVASGIALFASNAPRLALMTLLAVALTIVPNYSRGPGYEVRNFFGVMRVADTPDKMYRLFVHGTTIHGGQKLRTAKGVKLEHAQPILYHVSSGPLAQGFGLARAGRPGARLNVGVVGLGAGSLACAVEDGDSIAFFEIDPQVVAIARDPQYFTFLSSCAPRAPIVVGDARLTLAKTPAESYDYLVIDAFSSDAIPLHLLTREALQVYLSKIKPNGLIAINVSNRHMELASVVAATVALTPEVHAVLASEDGPKSGYDHHTSEVVYLSRDAALIERAVRLLNARTIDTHGTAAWSDNYSNILSAISRRYIDAARRRLKEYNLAE